MDGALVVGAASGASDPLHPLARTAGFGTTATAVGEERDNRIAALGEVRAIYAGANPAPVLALYRGLTWCQKCGAYSLLQAARGLARPCTGAPTPFGRTVLARLGRTPPRPPPHTAWAAEILPSPGGASRLGTRVGGLPA